VPDEEEKYLRAVVQSLTKNGYVVLLSENCVAHEVPKEDTEEFVYDWEVEYAYWCEICKSRMVKAETFLQHAAGKRHTRKLKQIQDLLIRLNLDPRAKKINLHNRHLTNKDANDVGHWIKDNNILKDLNLSWNKISDHGIRELCMGLESNSVLTKLNLYDNLIGDEGARHLGEVLKMNHTLCWLHLGCNKIDHAGAFGLARGLKVNSGIKHLYLYDNQIGDGGACCLADALKKRKKTVKTLLIWRNYIEEEGLKAMKSVKKVHSRFNVYFEEDTSAFK